MIHNLYHTPPIKFADKKNKLGRDEKIKRWNYVWAFFLPMSSEQQTWLSFGSFVRFNGEHINLFVC